MRSRKGGGSFGLLPYIIRLHPLSTRPFLDRFRMATIRELLRACSNRAEVTTREDTDGSAGAPYAALAAALLIIPARL